jgi:hypothetical protein
MTAPATPQPSTAPPVAASVPAPRAPDMDAVPQQERAVRPDGPPHIHVERCWWNVFDARWVCG